jgi:hypothetical protein
MWIFSMNAHIVSVIILVYSQDTYAILYMYVQYRVIHRDNVVLENKG